MNSLTIITHNGIPTVDSRDVAEMTGKQHAHLLRDIKGYSDILNQSNFGLVDFFIPSAYLDGKGEERPNYLLTRKGCDMVANKMTGEKGVLFTAAYVTKFEEMERAMQLPNLTGLSPQMQAIMMLTQQAAQTERQIQAVDAKVDMVNKKVENTIDLLTAAVEKDWRTTINHIIDGLCARCGLNYQLFRSELYTELEQKAACDLSSRQLRLRERMKKAGHTCKERMAITKIDIIERDEKLKQIFEQIVHKYQLKYAE